MTRFRSSRGLARFQDCRFAPRTPVSMSVVMLTSFVVEERCPTPGMNDKQHCAHVRVLSCEFVLFRFYPDLPLVSCGASAQVARRASYQKTNLLFAPN